MIVPIAYVTSAASVTEPTIAKLGITRATISLGEKVTIQVAVGLKILIHFGTSKTASTPDRASISLIYIGSRPESKHRHPDRAYRESFSLPKYGTNTITLELFSVGQNRILVLKNRNEGLGYMGTTGWAIRLRQRGPSYVGRFPIAGSLNTSVCDLCLPYAYSGEIRKPQDKDGLFSIYYRGWQNSSDGDQVTFERSIDYAMDGGRVVPRQAFDLPDQTKF